MSEYDKQAAAFLKKTNTTLQVALSEDQSAPHWAKDGKHGFKYDVILSNKNGVYGFSFWDSIANAEYIEALQILKNSQFELHYSAETYRAQDKLKGKLGRKISRIQARKQFEEISAELAPSAYSVLACLDIDYSDSFEDFCLNYGYDTDSRSAEATYKLTLEQDRQLRRLFTHEQLEALQEIA